MYTSQVLLEGPDYGGYLMAMNGLGGFLMVLMLSAFGFPSRKGLFCLIAAVAGAALTFTLSFNFGLIFAFVVLASHGITQTIYRTTNGLITQTLVKDEFRVRANSLYRVSNGSVGFVSESTKSYPPEIKYRDVHSKTLTNDVQSFPRRKSKC